MAESTIKETIELGKELEITSNTLHYKKVITNSNNENFIFSINSIFDKYYELMKERTMTIELTDAEYRKYIYKPKLLSLDLYGTTELDFLLLRLNNMTSCIYFNKQTFKVFDKDITTLLNEIMIHENTNYINNEVDIINKINQ
nr:MAG TPA: hypothetical protein [Caudoviricetes sp.]